MTVAGSVNEGVLKASERAREIVRMEEEEKVLPYPHPPGKHSPSKLEIEKKGKTDNRPGDSNRHSNKKPTTHKPTTSSS